MFHLSVLSMARRTGDFLRDIDNFGQKLGKSLVLLFIESYRYNTPQFLK